MQVFPQPTRSTPRAGLITSLLVLGGVVCLSLGCAPMEPQRTPSGPKFAASRMTPDAVALEIGLLQLDESQTELFEQFWKTLDHQKVELVTRQRLDENGFRAGLMPSHPPGAFQELIRRRPSEFESLDLVEQKLAIQGKFELKSRMIVHQRIVNRRSEIYRVETSEIHPNAQWALLRGKQPTYGSGEFVQGVVEITSAPLNDGTARIKLTPRINYGMVKTIIGVGEKEFAYDADQAGQVLSELSTELTLRPGETIVLAPTADRADLGRLLFESLLPPEDPHRTPSRLTHRVLLVRLVQTQLDDLFGSSLAMEPLSTNFPR